VTLFSLEDELDPLGGQSVVLGVVLLDVHAAVVVVHRVVIQ